uniref:Piwi domain-containing protein n=1 Tax=Rhabditophanes sp. KR3021 TaxID=114890 RepID=A0AC35U8B8_9BILA
MFESCMTSHCTLKETAKLLRYIVIQENINLTRDDSQNVTNSLCYRYQIANSPLYIAEQYVNRGKSSIVSSAKFNNYPNDSDYEKLASYKQQNDLKTKRVNA